MVDQQQTQQTQTALNKAINDYNSLRIRLATQPLLDQIELFLRGSRLVISQEEGTGRITTQRINVGVPKCNETGVQSIINWITNTLNSQTVQGNFTKDQYDNYIEEYHVELITMLVSNCYNWDIMEEDLDSVTASILLAIIPFISRLIDNKERESYGETMKMIESNTIRGKGGTPIFAGS